MSLVINRESMRVMTADLKDNQSYMMRCFPQVSSSHGHPGIFTAQSGGTRCSGSSIQMSLSCFSGPYNFLTLLLFADIAPLKLETSHNSASSFPCVWQYYCIALVAVFPGHVIIVFNVINGVKRNNTFAINYNLTNTKL